VCILILQAFDVLYVFKNRDFPLNLKEFGGHRCLFFVQYISYYILKSRTNKKSFRTFDLQNRNIMKETRLGDFEEVILLLVGILGKQAYAFKIAEEFEAQTGRAASIGAVHSTLTRISDKGFVTSKFGEATAERGGRRKRIYTITAYGQKVLQESRDFKLSLWQQYPSLESGLLGFTN
jgi:DNA-binding PadR family transcriptional regulator